jgi:anti-anti-sigma regulatory factor
MARHLLSPSTYVSGFEQMALKIESSSDGKTATLRLSGRINAELLVELQAQVRRHRPRLVFDLDEVTLVDVAVVRFLIACEAEGIELLHCAPYIREWMSREQRRAE